MLRTSPSWTSPLSDRRMSSWPLTQTCWNWKASSPSASSTQPPFTTYSRSSNTGHSQGNGIICAQPRLYIAATKGPLHPKMEPSPEVQARKCHPWATRTRGNRCQGRCKGFVEKAGDVANPCRMTGYNRRDNRVLTMIQPPDCSRRDSTLYRCTTKRLRGLIHHDHLLTRSTSDWISTSWWHVWKSATVPTWSTNRSNAP